MQKCALGLIRFYQYYLSWLLGPNVCRYSPTCSQYTYEAIGKYGILRGSWQGLKRLLTCHPWQHD